MESLVIFLYGITNVWMERFGAAAGSPFTIKQMQHVGIAVSDLLGVVQCVSFTHLHSKAMFWFAGFLGLAIESHRIRSWLAAPALERSRTPGTPTDQPPSYVASFNPFPALVIGTTGAIMSAHHQTYLFQVVLTSVTPILVCLTHLR